MKQHHHGNLIFISNIKQLRYIERLTQEKFAESVGVKRTLVGAWEEGRAMPTALVLAKMADVFKLDDLPAFITKPYEPIPKKKLWTNGIGDIESKFRRLSNKNKEIVKLILDSNP